MVFSYTSRRPKMQQNIAKFVDYLEFLSKQVPKGTSLLMDLGEHSKITTSAWNVQHSKSESWKSGLSEFFKHLWSRLQAHLWISDYRPWIIIFYVVGRHSLWQTASILAEASYPLYTCKDFCAVFFMRCLMTMNHAWSGQVPQLIGKQEQAFIIGWSIERPTQYAIRILWRLVIP